MTEYTFPNIKKYIINHFNEKDYVGLFNGKKQSCTTVVNYNDNYGQNEIQLTFPGYKAKIVNSKVQSYDFRVSVFKHNIGINTAPSHVNVLVDLHNKVKRQPNLYEELQLLLYNLSTDTYNNPLEGTDSLLKYSPSKMIDLETKNQIINYHRKLNKFHNVQGNDWDYSVKDLIHIIKWIVLQEDINYPINRGFLGRKMPFSRYYEALYVAINDTHTLEEVIERTLSHRRPLNWNDFDYRKINEIT